MPVPGKLKNNHWLILVLTLAVLLLGIWGWLVFSQDKTTPLPLTDELACSQDSDCITGIQATSCCSCPEAVNKKLIGTQDWEEYELGKDYSSQKLELCGGAVACSPCELPAPPVCSSGRCQFSLSRDLRKS
jgi:hypothetical protein